MSLAEATNTRQTVCPQSVILIALLFVSGCNQDQKPSDPLPSWNEGAARTSIVEFVQAVTDETGPDFVPVPERIAVFDNDGTLWSEKPVYFQLFFAMDRVRELAPGHPEWKTTQPFQAVLENDMEALDCLEAHKTHLGNTGLTNELTKLEEKIEQYDFESALEGLNKMARSLTINLEGGRFGQ